MNSQTFIAVASLLYSHRPNRFKNDFSVSSLILVNVEAFPQFAKIQILFSLTYRFDSGNANW